MKKTMYVLAMIGFVFGLLGVVATPSAEAAQFVCPVLGGQAGENGNATVFATPPAGGFYSIIGPEVSVPTHATNDDGAGSPGPGGTFLSPGDVGYTAIWN